MGRLLPHEINQARGKKEIMVATFAQLVKERRRALGIAQKELAQCAGCSVKTIEKIEAGERRPSRQIADLLAECLDILPTEREPFLELARAPLPAPPLGLSAKTATSSTTLTSTTPTAGSATAVAITPSDTVRWAAPSTPNNLPAPATAFIGREREVEQVADLILRPGVRLLTLSGPPGIGKTRLSVQVATHLLPHFEDGVYFVALAPVRDPSLVAAAIAHTLKVRQIDGNTLLESLHEYLRDRTMLLVLDNFEHLLSAGTVVGALLSASPGLTILTSSREPLHVYGEHDYPVPPLSLPDVAELPPTEQLAEYEAVRLFVERAAALRSGFQLTESNARTVALICTRLDGLALAIELAAARVRHLSPEQILAHLSGEGSTPPLQLLVGGPQDLPDRQRTLRGAIAWSYDLLSEDEQAVFRRLGVFVGGGTLAACETVCAIPADHLTEVLESLVDKSLLRREGDAPAEVRYWMLETIREYALEKLRECGEDDDTRKRHSEFFLAFAADGNAQLGSAEQAEWLNRMDVEHDNFRAVLQRAIERGDALLALNLSGTMRWFWYLRGYMGEGRQWLADAVAMPGADTTRERAEALIGLGVLAERMGEYQESRNALLESIKLWRALGDREGVAKGLHNLANVALEHGDYEHAEQYYMENLAFWRETNDTLSIGMTLHNLSMIAYTRGDYDRAIDLCQECITLLEGSGNMPGVGRSLITMGEVARLKGDYEQAGEYYERSLRINREYEDSRGVNLLMYNLGYVELHRGNLPKAEDYFREAFRLDIEAGDRPGITLDLIAMAGIAAAKGDPEKAARLFGAAETLRKATDFTLDGADLKEYELSVEAARANLPGRLWDRYYAEGRTMIQDDAIQYALE
jgi:predicted ATPase/DNA-binding XRE family transcriptional regulator